MIKLSILILTIPNRINTFFPKIIDCLLKQIKDLHLQNEVEVIGLFDNKHRSVGDKRNEMLKLAQGDYLTFIDDDDRISDDYLKSIIEVINNESINPDVIVFKCTTTINKTQTVYSKYSIRYDYHQEGNQWRGKPAHTMIWRSSIAKKHCYPSKNFGEDVNWVVKASQDVKTEYEIDKTLYFYDFNSNISETRS